MTNNNGLLIAALVAIVAVVGLVILFKGGTSGATVGCSIHEELVMLDIADSQGAWTCVPLWSRAARRTTHADLKEGMRSEYGTPWKAYESSMNRRVAIAQWSPNLGESYEPHVDVRHDDWAYNRGETYTPDPEVFVYE